MALSAAVPAQRWLSHASALAVLPLIAGSVAIFNESPATALLGLVYFGGWLVYYWQTTWS